MPYTGPGDEKLPSNVKKLPAARRAKWVKIFNSTYGRCKAKGGPNCEATAFKFANGALKKMAEGEIPTELIRLMCPDCGDLLDEAGLEVVDFDHETADAVMTRLVEIYEEELEDDTTRAIASLAFAEDGPLEFARKGRRLGKKDPGFFRRCMKFPFKGRGFRDKKAFCAWLHERVLHYWPGSRRDPGFAKRKKPRRGTETPAADQLLVFFGKRRSSPRDAGHGG